MCRSLLNGIHGEGMVRVVTQFEMGYQRIL